MAFSAAISIIAAFVVGFINHLFTEYAAHKDEKFAQTAKRSVVDSGMNAFDALVAGSKGAITVAVACAVAMVLAIPGMAFAVDSPSQSTVGPVTGDNGVTLQITYTGPEAALIIEPTGQDAANVPSDTDPLASFDVYETNPGTLTADDGTIPGGLLMTWNVGSQYAGVTATVYVQHQDGATEAKTATVDANGSFSMNIDRLSIFSVSVPATKGDSSNTSSSSSKTDTSSKSPKTGTDVVPFAMAASAICLGGAAVCFARSRKNRNER